LHNFVSQGQTRADAIANVQEAIAGYLESLSDRNEAIPPAIEEEVVDVAV
jgi:predicted RNase H-like HicB family nuclease